MKQSLLFCIIFCSYSLIAQNKTDSIAQRNNAWLTDLEYLQQKIKTEHYQYTHTISADEFDSRVEFIRESIPQKTDLQIIGSFFELMAAIGDGHTQLNPPFQGPFAFSMLPLEFYLFEEGLFIRAAAPEYSDLVGLKIIKTGNMPVNKLLNKCAPLIGRDNDQQLQWILPIALMFSDTYHLVGATDDKAFVEFTLQKPGKKKLTVQVPAGPIDRDPMARFAPAHWSSMKDPATNLWTQDPDNFYWYEYIKDRATVYFQFNQVRNKPEQNLADFSKELFKFIKANDVGFLIIDIRLNNGGNNFLNRSLVKEIENCEEINRKGRLFTITGRRTFSAAMNLASDLENRTETLFVGEPTGSKPNFYGEDNPFELPNSKLTGSISNRYWQGGKTANDKRPWIAPDLPANLSAQQYEQNEDPALQAIWDYLDSEK